MRRTPIAVLGRARRAPRPGRGAAASVVDTYQRLAERNLKPAPLVPTTVPRTLAPRPTGRSRSGTSRGRRSYSVRIVHLRAQRAQRGDRGHPAASSAPLRRRCCATTQMAPASATARPTRIRGSSRLLGPPCWSAGVRARSCGRRAGSSMDGLRTRRPPLGQLRATARGLLHRLERDWIGGGSSDPESSAYGFALTTARTVSVEVEFEASCTTPGTTATTVRAGQGDRHADAARRGPLRVRHRRAP